MTMFFAFIDHTGGVPELDAIMAACLEQVNRDFRPELGCVDVAFRKAQGPDDRGENEIAVHFRDRIPEAPGALAYHQVTNGIPDLEIGVELFSSPRVGSESLQCGLSHELLETLGNPGANGWKDRGDGVTVAEEECDVVQNLCYESKCGGSVSNFLLRSYFIPGSRGPWDHLGVMTSQTDISNGYEIEARSPTGTAQVGNMLVPYSQGRVLSVRGKVTEWQRKRKNHKFSRAHRLGIKL